MWEKAMWVWEYESVWEKDSEGERAKKPTKESQKLSLI